MWSTSSSQKYTLHNIGSHFVLRLLTRLSKLRVYSKTKNKTTTKETFFIWGDKFYVTLLIISLEEEKVKKRYFRKNCLFEQAETTVSLKITCNFFSHQLVPLVRVLEKKWGQIRVPFLCYARKRIFAKCTNWIYVWILNSGVLSSRHRQL